MTKIMEIYFIFAAFAPGRSKTQKNHRSWVPERKDSGFLSP
jgi:hypothetical protein